MKEHSRKPLRRSLLPLLVVVAASAAARPAKACAFEDDAGRAAWVAHYREDQVALVELLALKAPTIVVAAVLREVEKYGWVNEFEVRRVLKGTLRVGAAVRFRSSLSNGGLDCTPAKDAFYNTVVSPGTEVLLYASGDHLMRATDGHDRKGLTLKEEIDFVKKAIEAGNIVSHDRP